MPDGIDKGVEVLNLHGGNPIHINLNVRKKLDKVLMGGKFAQQTVVNPTAFQKMCIRDRLAYSFDIALQNEFSLEENIALARQFLLENFVSRGMMVDFAVHQPDREDGGIPNPHFHVLCPIRPIEQNGKWGLKQRRVYELDEDGNRIRDQNLSLIHI